MPNRIHLEELPGHRLKMDCDGTVERWIELLLTVMNMNQDFAIAIIGASKFYLENKGIDLHETLKDIDKSVAEMEKKKK